MNIKDKGNSERFKPDELVVALSNLREIQRALHDVEVMSHVKDRSERLGLARLRLNRVASATRKLCKQDDHLARRALQERYPGPGEPAADAKITDLDILFFKLRDDFRRQNAGWIPTFGKNRYLNLRGFPVTDGGGEGDPVTDGGGISHPVTDGGGISRPVTDGGGISRPVTDGGGVSRPVTDGGGVSRPVTDGGSGGAPQRGGSEAPWARRAAKPGRGVRVAVLDTKLYPDAWLAGAYLARSRALLKEHFQPGALPASQGHATFIAGLILHRAPGAQLVVRPVLDADAHGSAWDAATTMADLAGSGVDVVNLSFGCYTEDGEPPLVLARAVSVLSAEMVIVASAGNHGNIDADRLKAGHIGSQFPADLDNTTPIWPAALDDVVAVGAIDANHRVAPFSPKVPWVDLVAPGVNVQSVYLTGEVSLESKGPQTSYVTPPTAKFAGTAWWSGTSFAAANVSGAIAARTRPGRRSAREALEYLLQSETGDIRRFPYP